MPIEESTFKYVRSKLPAPNQRAQLEEIAAGAKVSYHTLLKIAKGETSDPRVSTVESLARYFKRMRAA